MPSPDDGNLTALDRLTGVDLRLGASAAAAGLAVLSSGEAVLLAVLLAVAGGQIWTAAITAVAILAVVLRWGGTSLDAIAGAQSVLGPAAVVGSVAAAASAWLSGLALLLATPPGWAAPAFGLAAALALAGPAVHSVLDLVVRVVAGAVGVGLAMVAARWAPPELARPVALGMAVLAAVLAVLT